MFTLSRPIAAGALAAVLAACGGGDGGVTKGVTGSPSADEDERGSVGVPPAADAYCTRLGYTLVDGQCRFPDGTSCEMWSFFQGRCGQTFSYCAKHGGAFSSKTENMGTWTAIYGVCDLAGQQCQEGSFMQTGKCVAR